MKLEIITPNAKIFEGDISYLNAPGEEGCFGVLENHCPFLTTLKNGTVQATLADGSDKQFLISGGMADIADNQIKIFAESVK